MYRNKQFKYYDVKFNIKVEYVTSIKVVTTDLEENLIKIFEIVINDMGPGSYYKKIENIHEDKLKETIQQAISDAKKYIDSIELNKREQWEKDLDDLGFS